MGGAERAYFDTAETLRRAGHEVAFFSMKHPRNVATQWEQYFVDQVEYDDRMTVSKKIHAVRNIFWNREAERNMKALLDVFQPDVAHAHNIFHQISPSIFRPLKQRNIPIVMTLHDYKLISPNYYLFANGRVWDPGPRLVSRDCLLDRCVKNSLLKSAVCVLEGKFHKWVHAYDAVSSFLSPSRFLIEKFYEYEFPKKIEYLPNPIVPFPEDDSINLLSHAAPYVFIGRLSPEKGVDTIIRAMTLLPKEMTLHIVGEGSEEKSLRQLVDTLMLSDRVKFLGYLSGNPLHEERKRARALIISSLWYENMPYAVVEAMAAGKVVIASRMGGISEWIRDGENGFLFNAGDENDLAKRMLDASRTDANHIGFAARMATTCLQEERYLERILPLYDKTIASLVRK